MLKIPRPFLRSFIERHAGNKVFSVSFRRRTKQVHPITGEVNLEAGSEDIITCKLKRDRKPTKDWTPKRGGRMAYDPKKYNLLHVYTVEGPSGDFPHRGNHWACIPLDTVSELRMKGKTYCVIDSKRKRRSGVRRSIRRTTSVGSQVRQLSLFESSD